MARPLRIEYPNACYHVINRGNQPNTVFHDDSHYQVVVGKLGEFTVDFRVAMRSYSRIPNHFHLYLRRRDGDLSILEL